jgi:hypothetical protein
MNIKFLALNVKYSTGARASDLTVRRRGLIDLEEAAMKRWAFCLMFAGE